MLPASIEFPVPPEGVAELAPLDATVIDISAGGVCMRVAMDDEALAVMRQVGEGLYVEVEVAPSELRRYKVLGRVAWMWVPSMQDEDKVGSLGVDIKGVAEDDHTFMGKLRSVFARESEVDVERTSRIIRTRTSRVGPTPEGVAVAEGEKAESTASDDKTESTAGKG